VATEAFSWVVAADAAGNANQLGRNAWRVSIEEALGFSAGPPPPGVLSGRASIRLTGPLSQADNPVTLVLKLFKRAG